VGRGECSHPSTGPDGRTWAGFRAWRHDWLSGELTPSDPRKAVVEAYERVESAVQDLVGVPGQQPHIAGSELTRVALDREVINRSTAEAIDGLTVMRNLAVHGGREVGVERAQEFVVLADAVLFVIRMERPDEERLER
jgi:hypothetical protein